MSEQNKTLQYVLVIGLPETEINLLIKNISDYEDDEDNLEYPFHTYIYDLPENTPAREEISGITRKETESFLEDFKQFPPDLTLVVSGESCCLELADNHGMATVGYLAKNSKESEETVVKADIYAQGFDEIGWAFLQLIYMRHHYIPWKILETERCIVQEFSMDWLPALFELYEGEGMTDYIEPLYDYEKEAEYQRAYIENMYRFYGYGMWIVIEKETGKLIGRAGLEFREDLGGCIELGYVIGTPYQRQGYATEVCNAILDYAKDVLEFKKVCCVIERKNKVSRRFAKKLGFRKEKRLVVDGRKMVQYVKKLREYIDPCTIPFCMT